MKDIRTSIVLLAIMTLFCGVVYPSTLWLIGQTCFRTQTKGSLLYQKGQVVGSTLIAQAFTSEKYFWPRPSATQGHPYQFFGSGGSHLSAANPFHLESMKARAVQFRKSTHSEKPVPVDMITSSGSGLDPDISPASAQAQTVRIARARHLTEHEVTMLIEDNTHNRLFGFIGEPRVNIMQLNRDLDHMLLRSQ